MEGRRLTKRGAKKASRLSRPRRLVKLLKGGCSVAELSQELDCSQILLQGWVERVSGQKSHHTDVSAPSKTSPMEEWLKGLS